MIRELGSAIGGTYCLVFGLFTTAAAAGLWMGAALLELLQHAAEWQLGMFTRGDGIEAGSESRIRMYFGVAKVAGVLVCTYLVPRYLYQDRDWQRVLRPDKDLMRGTIVVIGTLALTLGLIELSAAAAVHINVEQPWGLLIGVALTIPLVAVLPWGIGLIAGDHSMTLRKSVSAMRRRWIWANLLILVCLLPTVIPHYVLNFIAYGASPAVVGTLLLLDSVLVGFIALLMGSSVWIIYRLRVLDALT